MIRTHRKSGLDVHVSVDPTQIGAALDWAIAQENAFKIGDEIRRAARGHSGVNCLMLDMEDTSLTQKTIDLHQSLVKSGLPTAQTLQAYLRRTEADIRKMIALGAKVRLVRGAFVATPDIAFTKMIEIKQNYRSLARLMLSPGAKAGGLYPIFATHDHLLHDYIIEFATSAGWSPRSFEFEMLYGARPDVATSLAARGHRIRLYLPFGRDWWPYAARRIGENPRAFWLLARSFLPS